jgi:hypothetical protein
MLDPRRLMDGISPPRLATFKSPPDSNILQMRVSGLGGRSLVSLSSRLEIVADVLRYLLFRRIFVTQSAIDRRLGNSVAGGSLGR